MSNNNNGTPNNYMATVTTAGVREVVEERVNQEQEQVRERERALYAKGVLVDTNITEPAPAQKENAGKVRAASATAASSPTHQDELVSEEFDVVLDVVAARASAARDSLMGKDVEKLIASNVVTARASAARYSSTGKDGERTMVNHNHNNNRDRSEPGGCAREPGMPERRTNPACNLSRDQALSSDNSTTAARQPGAFAHGPREGLNRRDDNSLDGFEDSTPIQPTLQATANNGNNDNNNEPPSGDGLAEAMPVDDNDQPDMEAQPYDVEGAERKKLEESNQQRNYFVILAFVLVCVVAGVVLGVKFNDGNKNDKVPQTFPSLAPATTEAPSFAPSGVLDMLRETLPGNTLQRLGIFGTPQWKAWDWLLNHHNISNLEEWRKKQLFALAAFYFAFAGEKWNPLIQERWMDYEKEECLWFSSGFGWFVDGEYQDQPEGYQSFPCNEKGEFITLHLENLNLTGLTPSIPPEIALLSSLSYIALPQNNISTPLSNVLPSDLLQLANLKKLHLGANHFTGSLPMEILGKMTDLSWLELSRNSLTGTLPSELGFLTSLTEVYTYDNSFVGSLPSEVGLLTAMTHLDLFANSLGGRLPSELGMMTNLRVLRFSFSGADVPVVSVFFPHWNLTRLFHFDNMFTGAIPSEIGLLTSLTALTLGNKNDLFGSIPSQFGVLPNLTKLDLSNMPLLRGYIPSELSLLPNLGYFNLSGSSGLTGTIPQDLCHLQNASCSFLDLIGGFYEVWEECLLGFDCSNMLCGCDCPCSNMSL